MNFTTFNAERTTNFEAAINLAEKELSSLKLSYSMKSLGGEGEIVTYSCVLRNQDGIPVSLGIGKGIGGQSLASALFESIEHLFTNVEFISDPIHFAKVASLSEELRRDKACQLMIDNHLDALIPMRVYREIKGENKIYYPLFMGHPDYILRKLDNDEFEYSRLARYSTNNGTAIGVSFTEASIHAVSEIIERDAFSLFLIKSFVRKKPAPVLIIRQETLPPRLMELVKSVELMIGYNLVLIDMTTDFEIPSICVVVLDKHRPKFIHGCGASLSKEYACERAVLEALQSWHIYTNKDTSLTDEDERIIRCLEELPAYQKCARLDLAAIIMESELVSFRSFNDIPIYNLANFSIENYWLQIQELIYKRGYNMYYSINHQSESGLIVLHYVIPGTESFHLVCEGNPVLPNSRGLSVLYQ